MKSISLIVFGILISASISNAQINKSSAFISGLVGGAQINNSGINSDGSLALTFGGSFGIPLTKHLFLYARTSYSSKSNFQSFYNTSSILSQISFSDEYAEARSSFSQLLINGGLLYNFYVADDLTIGVSSGLSFFVVNQEAKLLGGHVISNIDNETVWGYFAGLMVEKGWGDDDLTTFAEAQYNYANSDASYIVNALNAFNFTFGVRYYLSSRRF
ncbi:MAG: hypothetical protein PVF17_03510 [Ignavibacteria bacterium]